MGYFSRLNILLMITVFKLQPQLFDYNYLHKCVYTYVSWLLFRLVEFSNNIATLAEISSGLFVSRGDTPYIGPFRDGGAHNYLWAPASTGRLRPKDHLFSGLYTKGPEGTAHVKGEGMLVGNFE